MFAVAPTDLNWFQQLRTEGINGTVINFGDYNHLIKNCHLFKSLNNGTLYEE